MEREWTDLEWRYHYNSKEADEKLKPLLTDEFLETLLQAVKTLGWSADHLETSRLVGYCYELAGKEIPDMTPYDYHAGGAG